MKKVFIFSFKVFICSLITLLFVEVGLRIFPSLIPLELLIHFEPGLKGKIARGRLATYDDTIIFNRDDNGPKLRLWKPFTKFRFYDSHVPGDAQIVKADEIGFCNPPGIYSKNSIIDIITIGDSFTWCNAVKPDDTWTKLLSDFTGLSTYNLGRGGVGLYEYLQILKGFGIKKSPRLVILNVYEGNDLSDAIRYHQSKHKYVGKNITSSSYPREIFRFLAGTPVRYWSYSFNFVLATIKYTYAQISSLLNYNSVDFRYYLVFSKNSIPFSTQTIPKNEVLYAKRLLAQEISFKFFKEALENFVRLSKEYNFTPIITYTPSAHTAYSTSIVFNEPTLGDILQRFSNKQREFFRLQGQELGYIFIDFTPSLQSAALSSNSQKLLYYRTNLHLTKYGHEIVAETLSKSLQNLGLLK